MRVQNLIGLLLVACVPSGEVPTDPEPPTSTELPTSPFLDCAEEDLVLALTGGSAFDNLGDADPASPEEVGDGQYHLFVGVQHAEDEVYVHDATASRPEGPYALGGPLTTVLDDYDQFGIETPAYLRFDDTTEYVYYCGLFTSNAAVTKGNIAALKRIDGGPWQKIGVVADFEDGATTHCEPSALLDPSTGNVHLYYGSDGNSPGNKMRISADPEDFPGTTERSMTTSAFLSRPSVSFDPVQQVYRMGFDVGEYPIGIDYAAHAWNDAPWFPDALLEDSERHSAVMHVAAHDLHPEVHVPVRGAVFQNGGALYDDSGVVQFFTGIGTEERMQVYAQRCTRR